jgi:sterol 3beta-glucosyltransferase
VANAGVQPAAGSLSLFIHPARGAWKSVQRKWAKKQAQSQRITQIQDGKDEMKNLADVQRDESMLDKVVILDKFEVMKKTTNERKKKLKQVAEMAIMEDICENETVSAASSSSPNRPSLPLSLSSSTINDIVQSEDTTSEKIAVQDDNAALERDVELAK